MLDGHSEKMQYYNTEKFRPVLINEINHSHIMLVDKIDCEKIDKNDYDRKQENNKKSWNKSNNIQ